MSSFLAAYDIAYGALRVVFFVLALVALVAAVLDWMVRTRRVGPFNPLARFARSTIDPMLAPIEQRVVRSGGLPQNAPWWALVAIVVAGILVLSLLGFLRQQIAVLAVTLTSGPRAVAFLIVELAIGLLQLAIAVRIVSALFRVSPYSRWVRWSYRLSEPLLAPLRRVLPPVGMFDLSPIVAWLLLGWVLRPLLLGVISYV